MPETKAEFFGRVVERTHRIALNGEADQVFPLFGPIREADWVAGWEPEMVAGDGLTPERGCVFRTFDTERGETVWLLAQLDFEDCRIGYLRATPQSDLAEITIEVESDAPGRSVAAITYRVTGLSEAGNRYAESFTEQHYQEWIDEWAVAINHYLATGHRLPTHL